MEKMGRVKGGKRVNGYRKENRMRVMGRKRGMVKGGIKREGYEREKWGWLWGKKGTVIGRTVGDG